MNRFRSGEFAWTDARPAFFGGFHASLAAYADTSNDLILEHILDTDGWLETLCELLMGEAPLSRGFACGGRCHSAARRDQMRANSPSVSISTRLA